YSSAAAISFLPESWAPSVRVRLGRRKAVVRQDLPHPVGSAVPDPTVQLPRLRQRRRRLLAAAQRQERPALPRKGVRGADLVHDLPVQLHGGGEPLERLGVVALGGGEIAQTAQDVRLDELVVPGAG